MSKDRTGHPSTGNMEWGSKARKEEDALRGRNNAARKAAVAEQVADVHGNVARSEGCDRCTCGCKYWENDRCTDCGGNEVDRSDYVRAVVQIGADGTVRIVRL